MNKIETTFFDRFKYLLPDVYLEPVLPSMMEFFLGYS